MTDWDKAKYEQHIINRAVSDYYQVISDEAWPDWALAGRAFNDYMDFQLRNLSYGGMTGYVFKRGGMHGINITDEVQDRSDSMTWVDWESIEDPEPAHGAVKEEAYRRREEKQKEGLRDKEPSRKEIVEALEVLVNDLVGCNEWNRGVVSRVEADLDMLKSRFTRLQSKVDNHLATHCRDRVTAQPIPPRSNDGAKIDVALWLSAGWWVTIIILLAYMAVTA